MSKIPENTVDTVSRQQRKTRKDRQQDRLQTMLKQNLLRRKTQQQERENADDQM